MAKTYTPEEIDNINLGGTSVFGADYTDTRGYTFVGVEDGRLRIKDQAKNVIYASATNNTATNVQSAIDNINTTLLNRSKLIEINFGDANYITQETFIILDANVKAGDRVMAEIAYVAPTGKDLDEVEMDRIALNCGAFDGGFNMLASASDGSVYGTYKVSYSIN